MEYPDRLELRLSANGSCDPGSRAQSVGDFTTLLESVNPDLVTGVYPQVWTRFSGKLKGLAGVESGCLAFRYFVTNGGPGAQNSDYLGVDTFAYEDYEGDACADAKAALANAKSKLRKAKARLAGAKRKLKRARKAGKAAQAKRAKRKVKAAKRPVKAGKRKVASAKAERTEACAAA